MDEAEHDPAAENNRSKGAGRAYRARYTRAVRRPAAQREHAFDALAWLIEGASGFAEELRHSDLGLSEEFWVHFYAMRREGLDRKSVV